MRRDNAATFPAFPKYEQGDDVVLPPIVGTTRIRANLSLFQYKRLVNINLSHLINGWHLEFKKLRNYCIPEYDINFSLTLSYCFVFRKFHHKLID